MTEDKINENIAVAFVNQEYKRMESAKQTMANAIDHIMTSTNYMQQFMGLLNKFDKYKKLFDDKLNIQDDIEEVMNVMGPVNRIVNKMRGFNDDVNEIIQRG